MREQIDVRFLRKLAFDEFGCWLWIGAKSKGHGYLRMWDRALSRWGSVGAHRWSYERFVGSIPQGMEVDHVCRRRACVNPAHLRIVTPRQNVLENSLSLQAANSQKVVCPRGHPLLRRESGGGRWCRPCQIEAKRRYRERQRARAMAAA
jgi:hypothetical protein